MRAIPVTQNTPIASLHNALFFKEYVNSGNRVTVHGSPTDIVRAAVDNDYRTFSNVTDYAIDIVAEQPTHTGRRYLYQVQRHHTAFRHSLPVEVEPAGQTRHCRKQ